MENEYEIDKHFDRLIFCKVMQGFGYSLNEASKAFRLRDGNWLAAKEYLDRRGIAMVMHEHARYPIWTSIQRVTDKIFELVGSE